MMLRRSLAGLSAISALCSGATATGHPTLQGMIVWGYQGWYTGNWKWFSPSNVVAGPPENGEQVLTDYLPYTLDYPAECLEPTNFILADGSHASWFYSNCSSVVQQHFEYMSQYDIDAIFVQRFMTAADPSDPTYQPGLNVLQWVQQYAEAYGKSFAVEYDYSQLRTTDDQSQWFPIFQNDLQNNVAPLFQSSAYIYQDNKPVVEIWGAGFNGGSNGADGQQLQLLVNELHNSPTGAWVVLGVPNNWLSYAPGGYSTQPSGMWQLYQTADCIQPWGVGAYNSPEEWAGYFSGLLQQGKAQTDSWGIAFSPVIHPGTENYHASGQPMGQNNRYNTTLLEYGLGNVTSASFNPHFVFGAMFDEYTEGSQILPSYKFEDLPTNPNPGFAGQDDDKSYYVYLEIAGKYTPLFHQVSG